MLDGLDHVDVLGDASRLLMEFSHFSTKGDDVHGVRPKADRLEMVQNITRGDLGVLGLQAAELKDPGLIHLRDQKVSKLTGDGSKGTEVGQFGVAFLCLC